MRFLFPKLAILFGLISIAAEVVVHAQAPEVPGSLPTVLSSIPRQEVDDNGLVVDLTPFFGLPGVTGSIYQVSTTLGEFNIEMLATDAPATVANFINYVNVGAYTNALIHRSMPNFVIQTGGFTATLPTQNIAKFAAVVNEFGVPNTRGTLAMAKVGGDPNSATNQWFVNLADNRSNLDNQNGGFTVFARVLGTGMEVLDAIAAVQVYNAGSPYDNLPLRNMLAGQANVELQNLLAVNSVRAASVVPSGAAPTSVISFTAQSVHPERANASISGSSLHLSNVKAVTTVRVIATDTNGNSVETTVEVAPTPLSAGVAEKAVLGLAARIWGGSATRIVGLPSGLRLNVDTQTLEGFPRRAGTYKSRALVVAGDGSRHWEYFWFTVDALPSWMGGNFDLVMERSEFVGGGLGGAVALRVAASGAASGRLSLPGLNLPFRGLMEKISETEGRLVVDFPANARLPEPLQLEVTVTPDGQAVGRVIGIAGEATLSGWRNTWHATNQPLDGERLGQMNLLMDLASGSWAEANDLVPQGTGWTILRTNRAGRGVMRVKLSDGTPVSGAITVGPGGEIAAWRPLYRNGGSVMLAGGIDEFGKVMGTGTWIRHQSSNLRERRYPEGFGQGIDGPVALEIEGGRWVAPAPGATVLGLPYEASNPEPNASLSWAMGGLADSETAVDDLPLIIDPRNLAKLPAGWANPARVTALLNPAAGLITLRMVIDDENPLFAGKRVRRAVVHQVLLVPPFADGRIGGGCFLLGQLADPNADPPTTPRTSPILSGKVRLDAVVPASSF